MSKLSKCFKFSFFQNCDSFQSFHFPSLPIFQMFKVSKSLGLLSFPGCLTFQKYQTNVILLTCCKVFGNHKFELSNCSKFPSVSNLYNWYFQFIKMSVCLDFPDFRFVKMSICSMSICSDFNLSHMFKMCKLTVFPNFWTESRKRCSCDWNAPQGFKNNLENLRVYCSCFPKMSWIWSILPRLGRHGRLGHEPFSPRFGKYFFYKFLNLSTFSPQFAFYNYQEPSAQPIPSSLTFWPLRPSSFAHIAYKIFLRL